MTREIMEGIAITIVGALVATIALAINAASDSWTPVLAFPFGLILAGWGVAIIIEGVNNKETYGDD